jgi:hypothetical protein
MILEEFFENVEYNEKENENKNPPGYVAAICNPNYRRATWVAVALAVFTQTSGLASLSLYSNAIIVFINNVPNSPV